MKSRCCLPQWGETVGVGGEKEAVCGGAGVVGYRQVWPRLPWTSVTLKAHWFQITCSYWCLLLTGSSRNRFGAQLHVSFSVYKPIAPVFLSRSNNHSVRFVFTATWPVHGCGLSRLWSCELRCCVHQLPFISGQVVSAERFSSETSWRW